MAKIMVVDDERDFVAMMSKLLRGAGHEIIEAYGGVEALEKLKSVKPDLILLDVMMPDIDGYDICKIIRENHATRDITIAMLTVRFADQDKLRSLEDCGANWHIAKSADKKDLLEKIDWLLKTPPTRMGESK